jgi:amino acid transporter
MSTTGQGISSSWNERMRLIRLRRKKERPRLRDELRMIPRWMVWSSLGLYILALVVVIPLLLFVFPEQISPPELRSQPFLAALAIAGGITVAFLVIALLLFPIGYVYRDAKRRDMNSLLWTLLVILLLPAWGVIGFIIYFLVREPLPYPCPRCANLVGPRFNFCPNCKCNLHPSCPSCKREIAETDKFCPYCAQQLSSAAENKESVTSQD